MGAWAQLNIQFYSGVPSLTGFSFLVASTPHLVSVLFIFVSLFVEVEFWPGEAQHLSVGEAVGGNKCIFRVTALLCIQSMTPAVRIDTCVYSSLRGKLRYLIYGRAQPDFRKYLAM